MGDFGIQELSNTSWAFAELRIRDEPLCAAISDRAHSVLSSTVDEDEIARSGYALAWAFAMLRYADPESFAAGNLLADRGGTMLLGLCIQDEEWRKRADGTLAALEALVGRGPTRVDASDDSNSFITDARE